MLFGDLVLVHPPCCFGGIQLRWIQLDAMFGSASSICQCQVILQNWIPVPTILVALLALALGLLGAAAGLYRQCATQAFAEPSSKITRLLAAGFAESGNLVVSSYSSCKENINSFCQHS